MASFKELTFLFLLKIGISKSVFFLSKQYFVNIFAPVCQDYKQKFNWKNFILDISKRIKLIYEFEKGPISQRRF